MKHIKKYVELMKHENVSRAILVTQQNLTPFAKSFLVELSSTMHIEVFSVGFRLNGEITFYLEFQRSLQELNMHFVYYFW